MGNEICGPVFEALGRGEDFKQLIAQLSEDRSLQFERFLNRPVHGASREAVIAPAFMPGRRHER